MALKTHAEGDMAHEQNELEEGSGAGERQPEVAAFAESSFSREDSKGQLVNFQVPLLLCTAACRAGKFLSLDC